jgi:hypothetical protein
MKYNKPPHHRVLAIAPSHRGFGYALFEGIFLVDWGTRVVSGKKNVSSLAEAKLLILQYQPGVLALEDLTDSKRGDRVRALVQGIIDLGRHCKVAVKQFSREQMNKAFFEKGEGTKYELAELMVKEFPEELGFRLPPKRRAWTSEDYRMALFDAVVLGLLLGLG